MSDLTGLTREECALACNANGCAITGLPRCCHPLKGGPPIDRLKDLAVMGAFAAACSYIGVGNAYNEEKAS